MKIRPIRIATLIVIAISTFAPAHSQTTYAIPRAVSFDRILRRTYPVYYGREEYQTLEVDGFYPIGWSRDGKFAYYIEPVDEACGCYYAELIIQDLKTDKVVWKFKNDPESRMDDKGEIIADDMRKLWKRNEKMFYEKLTEHGIVSTRFELLGRSFSSGGKAFAAKMVTSKGSDEYDMDHVKTIRLELSSTALGRKTLFTKDFSADLLVAPIESAVVGAFKSPFENRAAVVMINIQRGWEGPPHTVDIQIAGADLVKGFR